MPRLPLFLRRSPPPEAIRWVERSLGRGYRVTSVRRLRGGTSAAVHLLQVRDARGETQAVVLRRFVRSDWFEEEPDAAEREARVLRAIEGLDVPAPRLLAVDPTGAECDVAAVLMTRVPGGTELVPADLDAYLRALAEPLPALHALGPIEGVPSYYPYFMGADSVSGDQPPPEPPSWSRKPDLWRAAARIVTQPWPQVRPTFIHRDYHPGNILWSRGRLSGVTDWVSASNGPAGMDAAHCRINLAGLFGVPAAEVFRQAYEAIAGVEHHPFWDLLDALDTTGGEPGWHDAGRHDLTAALLHQRDEEYVEMLVRRLC
ncbi:MAG: aminoglycoside phosphotransferase family protein [Dehalococcoidia bacterium]|nr:aminoglycoside phosphotransferase family protein [Dehalococcoidia bacterium]